MFRMWAKLFKDNKMLKDTVIINDDAKLTRTKKVFSALEEACNEFDLAVPIWLEFNVREFKKIAKTRFRSDNFIETIEFDYLEIQIIEEDSVLF